jgi:hypothetical protein
MEGAYVVLPASSDYRYSQSHRESGFKIYASSLTSEVGYNETASSNFRNYAITNLLIVFF